MSAVAALQRAAPRVAVVYEVFDDDEGDSVEVGQWVQQRDSVIATHIHYRDLVVVFENQDTDDCLLVGADNLISAWTEGVGD